jgi:hypothetical protein
LSTAPVKAAFLFSFILLNFQSFYFLFLGSFGMAALAVNGTGDYGKLRKMFFIFLYFPWLSGHLMPKRRVQNVGKDAFPLSYIL